jgi:hypothetical protein
MDWWKMNSAGTGYFNPRYRYILPEKGALNKAPFSFLNIIFEGLGNDRQLVALII